MQGYLKARVIWRFWWKRWVRVRQRGQTMGQTNTNMACLSLRQFWHEVRLSMSEGGQCSRLGQYLAQTDLTGRYLYEGNHLLHDLSHAGLVWILSIQPHVFMWGRWKDLIQTESRGGGYVNHIWTTWGVRRTEQQLSASNHTTPSFLSTQKLQSMVHSHLISHDNIYLSVSQQTML